MTDATSRSRARAATRARGRHTRRGLGRADDARDARRLAERERTLAPSLGAPGELQRLRLATQARWLLIGARSQAPVEIAQVVARIVLAILGELSATAIRGKADFFVIQQINEEVRSYCIEQGIAVEAWSGRAVAVPAGIDAHEVVARTC